MSTPQNSHHPCLCPCREPSSPPPPRESLQSQQAGLAQAPMRPLHSSGPVQTRPCVCPPSVQFVSLGLRALLGSTPAGFKARCSGGASSPSDAQAGALAVRIFTAVWQPLWWESSACRLRTWRVCELTFHHGASPPSRCGSSLLWGRGPPLGGRCRRSGWGRKAFLVATFAVAELVNEDISGKSV